jgi:hypothetical protein
MRVFFKAMVKSQSQRKIEKKFFDMKKKTALVHSNYMYIYGSKKKQINKQIPTITK